MFGEVSQISARLVQVNTGQARLFQVSPGYTNL